MNIIEKISELLGSKIGQVFIITLAVIFGFWYNGYFAGEVIRTQENLKASFNEIQFPDYITYKDDYKIETHERKTDLFVMGHFKGERKSVEEVNEYYKNKLEKLGWQQIHPTVYRKDDVFWLLVGVEHDAVYLVIREYIFGFESDGGIS